MQECRSGKENADKKLEATLYYWGFERGCYKWVTFLHFLVREVSSHCTGVGIWLKAELRICLELPM